MSPRLEMRGAPSLPKRAPCKLDPSAHYAVLGQKASEPRIPSTALSHAESAKWITQQRVKRKEDCHAPHLS
jgi:hypothetical protein